MTGTHRLLWTFALLAAAGRAGAQAAATEPPASPSAVEWRSMSRAKVAVPLPPSSPMAAELAGRAPPAKWQDVPLPPPPALTPAVAPPRPAAAPAPARAAPPPAAVAVAAVTPPAPPTTTAPRSTEPVSWQAYPRQYPLPQFLAAASPAPDAAPQPGPSKEPAVEDAAVAPVAAAGGDGAEQSPTKEPRTKLAADPTGVMLSVTQDLESDRIRQDWAASGGTIQAFEASGGMTLLYKDLSEVAGEGSYMSGVGFNIGGRINFLNLTPPKYETRDRNWVAFKVGGGADLGALTVTINTPSYNIGGTQIGGKSTASMTSLTLVGTVGFMYAFGSFDSPSDWSGMAVGAEWAPSRQSNTMTDSQSGESTTTSSFNATGFAINFESGSLQSMAAKMGKKAHLKVRLFFLPPVGEMPFMMTASLGTVWY